MSQNSSMNICDACYEIFKEMSFTNFNQDGEWILAKQ